MRPILLACLLLAPLAAATSAPAQSVWYVDVNGTAPGTGTALDPYTSIDFALNQPSTKSRDTVLVFPGTYAEQVSFVRKGVQLISTDGAGATVIDAGGAGSAVSFLGTEGPKMVIDGFTITGGTGTDVGGGVLAGGGIYGLEATVGVRNCLVRSNQATLGGGLYFDKCVATVARCRVRANMALEQNALPAGGGMYTLDGTTFVFRTILQGNDAGTQNNPGSGGGIFVDGVNDMTLRGCSILDNVGERSGGGLDGSALIDRCLIAGNLAQFGGGLSGSSTVTDSLIRDNLGSSASGTSHFGGGASGGTFSNCTFEGNVVFGEGAAANGSTLLVCEVRQNDSGTSDGSIVTGALDGCTVIGTNVFDNTATGTGFVPALGGGAANSDLINCDVARNQANSVVLPGSMPIGGGVYQGTVTDSRVYDNFCAGQGGGVAFATVLSTEITGNQAQEGAGCFDADLDRATVFGNVALGGGPAGMYVEFSGSVRNSILWGNGFELFAEPGASLDVTYSDVEGGWSGTGNIDADPLFWDAAGGDLHLTAGSPCIDAGDPASDPDPDGSRADMGALPFDPNYTGM